MHEGQPSVLICQFEHVCFGAGGQQDLGLKAWGLRLELGYLYKVWGSRCIRVGVKNASADPRLELKTKLSKQRMKWADSDAAEPSAPRPHVMILK